MPRINRLARLTDREGRIDVRLARHDHFGIGRSRRDRREQPADDRCGGRFKYDGHNVQPRIHDFSIHRHARGQLPQAHGQRPAELGAVAHEQGGRAVALRHGNRLAILVGRVVAIDLGNAGTHRGLHRRDFDAVEVIEPALLQVVVQPKRVGVVFWNRDAEVAVRPDGVVVARDGGTIRTAKVEHGIELRTDSPSIAVNVEDLPLLGGELEVVGLAGRGDHTVEGRWGGGARARGCRRAVVWSLQHVRQIDQPELEPGRVDAVNRLAVESPVGIVHRGGKFYLLLDGAGRIAEEGDFEFFVGLATSGNDGRGPGEVADVQAILAGTIATVSTLANLDDVLAVGRCHDRTTAVLADERRVVAGREFEPLRIEDGHVRVEDRHAEPHAFDFDREPLALLAIDDEVILILVIDDAVDRGVECDRLRECEVAVRFLLVDAGKRPDPEGAEFRDAGGSANAEGVFAEPAFRRNRERDLHLGIVDDFELLDGDARIVDQDFLSIRESSAVEGDDGLSAALSPAWLDDAEGGRGSRGGAAYAQNDKNGKRLRCFQHLRHDDRLLKILASLHPGPLVHPPNAQ